MMPQGGLKVLYIAGAGRSGSTVLANILGEVDGFCSVGEVRHIWDGMEKGWFCGCGTPLMECAFWSRVLATANSGVREISAVQLRQVRDRGLRSRHLLVPGIAPWKVASERMRGYLAATRDLYAAVQAETGCRVIVDSSKAASYRYLLEMCLGFDVYTLHLVRDPRAVAYAWWYRRKQRSPSGSDELLDRHHPIESALRWNESNVLSRRSLSGIPDRYRRVRYEDFVRNHEQVLTSVLTWLDAGSSALPISGHEVTLGTHHTVSGNPDRFQRGKIRIRTDEDWKTKMGSGHRLLVTAITWPELRRYDYPLFGTRDSESVRMNPMADPVEPLLDAELSTRRASRF